MFKEKYQSAIKDLSLPSGRLQAVQVLGQIIKGGTKNCVTGHCVSKGATVSLLITLLYADQFSEFLHLQTRQ